MARGNGLSDAYTTTLTRLRGQKGNKSVLGWKVLMWVLYSERPLQAEELCHALGVEIGSADLNSKNVPALRTLIASCLGLVTIEASSSRVRLVHFTLQEHLLNNPTLFHSPHAASAEVCLTYLNFASVRDLSPTLRSAPSTMLFLEYASCYWGKHTRMGMTENVKTLALRLLDRFGGHISAHLLLLHHNCDRGSGPYFMGKAGPKGFTGVHGAAFLGVGEIFSGVLEIKKWDLNATDCMGGAALTWAIGEGFEEIVKILLEQEDIDPNQAGTSISDRPLSLAAQKGHEGIVKMLLERDDANLNHPDAECGRTALRRAAEGGHEGVVKMLLKRDVNPDEPDTEYGRTPLSWAAEKGKEGILKLLLERKDVKPDQPDTKYGKTPLSWAVYGRRYGVVKMLLKRKSIDPNQILRPSSETVLLWATSNGHEEIVKILLEREDLNPDLPDDHYGLTPLEMAGLK